MCQGMVLDMGNTEMNIISPFSPQINLFKMFCQNFTLHIPHSTRLQPLSLGNVEPMPMLLMPTSDTSFTYPLFAAPESRGFSSYMVVNAAATLILIFSVKQVLVLAANDLCRHIHTQIHICIHICTLVLIRLHLLRLSH